MYSNAWHCILSHCLQYSLMLHEIKRISAKDCIVIIIAIAAIVIAIVFIIVIINTCYYFSVIV